MTEQASDRRFYSFWYGGELSPLAWACMSSFPRNGHALTLFSYDEIAVPAGIELGNARQVLPEDELFAFDRSFSAFSNVFRYQLLIERGGWWVDTDVYCQTPDLPACRYAWASECPDFINGAILRFPAGDPILRDLLAAARSVGTRVQQQGQLGPRLLTKHLAGLSPTGLCGSTKTFYPLHWVEAYRFWAPDGCEAVLQKVRNAWFVHFWSTMLRYLGIDERLAPPPGSYLSYIYQETVFGPRPLLMDDGVLEATRGSVRLFLEGNDGRETSRRVLGDDVAQRSEWPMDSGAATVTTRAGQD